MKYFDKCNTLDELKAEYRRLVKLHHPDAEVYKISSLD